jgi:hypothetical protein
MNRCYAFSGRRIIRCPPHHLVVAALLTQLFRRITPMHRRFNQCWRPCGQTVSVSFHATVGWTAADPSVHPVLKASSWCISVLFKLDHRIVQRFPPKDRRFIRRCCLRGFSSPNHPTQLGKGPSVHLTVSSEFQSLRSVPSAPTLLHRWYRRFIRRCLFPSFSSRLQLGSLLQLNILNILNMPLLIASKYILNPQICYK